MSVSLCVLRIEIDEDLPEMGDNPAERDAAKEQKRRDRGGRESRTITVETYASILTGPDIDTGILPSSSRRSPPKSSTSEDAETISFFCGNPLVEVTKGILHLYKEKFRTSKAAAEFHKEFDGVPYSTLEPNAVCHMAWVSRVEWGRDGAPPPSHTELPTCPVCLERMDESVAGVLSVQCAHAFHAECLARWQHARCPVCRCAQVPEPRATQMCHECPAAHGNYSQSVWTERAVRARLPRGVTGALAARALPRVSRVPRYTR
ncbi:Brca1-associated protein (Brap2) [Operophtera brumata]|uniref:Brca1-associated protein (Brap2) n=1 Tax=Operophtera brumata TaxID=104452 RepID=A0A0L7KP42_OPEBR|nr:Brca1-associated protein (Brap2) [Operophtera brumata]